MHLPDGFWTSITYVVSFFSPHPFYGSSSQEQAPFLGPLDGSHQVKLQGPIFKPPGGSLTGPDSNFTCDYSNMVGWTNCSTSEDRKCWLRNDETQEEFNITTDYETLVPIGIERYYELNVTDGLSVNADGLGFDAAKLFDGQYPGPWIQACWGDTVTVKVNNQLATDGGNGTSIHWHGIRQWKTMHMDGVNGLTQCPIAPGDSFTYTWKAMQYGSAWYHSHYSVQYADGALGPMTLHGPTFLPYDEAKDPILMTDWGHNSAFEAIQTSNLVTPSILLNGIGNVTRFNNSFKAPLEIPAPYTINFDPPPEQGPAKRYLLRLINTSFASTFIFSIDNHELQVVGADFVPILNYTTKSVLVAIGQRYHVIVVANPDPSGGPLPDDGNYWIRTWEAQCTDFDGQGDLHYEEAGIVRYGSSQAPPNSTAWPVDPACSDEDYANLIPVYPWTVGPPANDPSGGVGENLTVNFQPSPMIFPLAVWSLGGDDFNPLQIDYGNPTFLNLNYSGKWDPLWVVYPEDYTDTDWVYLVIKSGGGHPIHLHGHDFAILQQVTGEFHPEDLTLNVVNPPRRDVVLLPPNGYTVIAFKTDNPGTWLMHCHIAYHASEGLALQILERQQDAAAIWPSFNKSAALRESQRVCDNWNKWWGDCNDWWPGNGKSCGIGEQGFSPDSGI